MAALLDTPNIGPGSLSFSRSIGYSLGTLAGRTIHVLKIIRIPTFYCKYDCTQRNGVYSGPIPIQKKIIVDIE